ncbi:MAG TPA: AraC family transcriptional regulator [Steroidobacteraceae bacterium]|nr:AraC family transcriptional regulator [Steroidobacteraceae bacterium]
MKPSATGRILLWRGGSLWIGLAGVPAGFHSHHAVQIALPFEGARVRFQTPSADWVTYDAAIVAAEQPHAFDGRDRFMAQIFVEPESRAGRELQRRYRSGGVVALDTEAIRSNIAALALAYDRRVENTELIELAKATIARLAGTTPTPPNPPDKRVELAIEHIRNRLNQTISLKSLAAAVHLSPDRFRHLFIEETGIGLRPYVLWLRLERSLGEYVGGASLTDAAHAGGFADSAHLSRTFKRMFGISPASVRPE